MLGDADLNTCDPDDGTGGSPDGSPGDRAVRSIVDRLLHGEEVALPDDADRVLRELLGALDGDPEPDEATLRQVVAAAVWGVRSYAVASGEVDQLREALTSRSTIDQAKGILMSQEQVDPETAFQMLVRMSNDTNVRLVDVARALVYRASRTDQGQV